MRSSAQPLAYRDTSASISSRWSSTPVASRRAYGSGATGRPSMTLPAAISLASASYSSSRARSRAARRPSTRSLLGPGDVVAGSCIDLQAVAGVHEQRHLDDEAGFERGRLAGARDAVALDAGLGLAHRQLHRGGELDADDLVVVHRQLCGRSLDDEVRRAPECTGRHLQLLVALVVHEDELGAVAV